MAAYAKDISPRVSGLASAADALQQYAKSSPEKANLIHCMVALVQRYLCSELLQQDDYALPIFRQQLRTLIEQNESLIGQHKNEFWGLINACLGSPCVADVSLSSQGLVNSGGRTLGLFSAYRATRTQQLTGSLYAALRVS